MHKAGGVLLERPPALCGLTRKHGLRAEFYGSKPSEVHAISGLNALNSRKFDIERVLCKFRRDRRMLMFLLDKILHPVTTWALRGQPLAGLERAAGKD
jgi:hypothetical protein